MNGESHRADGGYCGRTTTRIKLRNEQGRFFGIM